jgi:hypothetical protein
MWRLSGISIKDNIISKYKIKEHNCKLIGTTAYPVQFLKE